METPNILLITIDSLRYDHLSCYGYPRNTTPNIDSLAKRGVRFLETISNGGHTPTAFPAILASELPPSEKSELKAVLQGSTTLAQVLHSLGYSTAAFHSNPQVSRFYGYNKGFDVFDDSLREFSPIRMRLWIRTMPKSPNSLNAKLIKTASRLFKPIISRVMARPIITAEVITKKPISWLETRQGKFFLWLHYMDVHHPYLPPAKYVSELCSQSVSQQQMKVLWRKMLKKPSELSPSDRTTLINLYDATIRYTDDTIGLLLDKLKNHLDNTIVIVTADHGEEFGEHGRFGHGALYEELLHVPLIIAGPGVKSGTLVKQQVSLIDLAPTIVDLIGIVSIPDFCGTSLLSIIEGKEKALSGTISTFVDPVRRQSQRVVSFRASGWKYIRTDNLDTIDATAIEEIYNLKNDPKEDNNLFGSGDEEASLFEAEAKRQIAIFRQSKAEERTSYEKARIKARLSKLSNL